MSRNIQNQTLTDTDKQIEYLQRQIIVMHNAFTDLLDFVAYIAPEHCNTYPREIFDKLDRSNDSLDAKMGMTSDLPELKGDRDAA